MASLTLTPWDGAVGFSWRVTGLGGTWDTSNYTEVGITTESFTSGTASIDESQVVSSVTPTSSSGTSYVTPTQDVVYEAGTYTFYAYAFVPNGKYYSAGSGTVTIGEEESGSVEDWSWETINSPEYLATEEQTQAAYTAITSGGLLTDFSYLVWNDMVYKTNEIIESRDGSWVDDYGTLSETLMTTSDKTMTANRYNAIRWNLAHFATPVYTSKKTSGDALLGEHFVNLALDMNNTIWRN